MREGFAVAFTKREREFSIARDLWAMDIEAFVAPLFEARTPRYLRGKKVIVKVPLYRRYLFFKNGARENEAVLAHRDVLGLVWFGDVLAVVKYAEINRIKKETREQAIAIHKDDDVITRIVIEDKLEPLSPLIEGEEVEISKGIFVGSRGEYLGERRGKARIVMIRSGKEFAVELPFDHVTKS